MMLPAEIIYREMWRRIGYALVGLAPFAVTFVLGLLVGRGCR